MIRFRKWVDEHFETTSIEGAEYVEVYTESNEHRTINYKVSIGDLYDMFAEPVEKADGLDQVQYIDVKDHIDSDWGYDEIVEDWKDKDIIVD